MKLLFVIDMQNDFIDGVLGSPEAQAIVPKVVEKIKNEDKYTIITATFDTHWITYLKTEEGKHLPIPHCLYQTEGWELNKDIEKALAEKDHLIERTYFGNLCKPVMRDTQQSHHLSLSLPSMQTHQQA